MAQTTNAENPTQTFSTGKGLSSSTSIVGILSLVYMVMNQVLPVLRNAPAESKTSLYIVPVIVFIMAMYRAIIFKAGTAANLELEKAKLQNPTETVTAPASVDHDSIAKAVAEAVLPQIMSRVLAQSAKPLLDEPLSVEKGKFQAIDPDDFLDFNEPPETANSHEEVKTDDQ